MKLAKLAKKATTGSLLFFGISANLLTGLQVEEHCYNRNEPDFCSDGQLKVEAVVREIEEDEVQIEKGGLVFNLPLSEFFNSYVDPVSEKEIYIEKRREKTEDNCLNLETEKMQQFNLRSIEKEELVEEKAEISVYFDENNNKFLVNRIIIEK